MAQSPEDIAKDIVVAWLSHTQVSYDINNPEKTGEAIGIIYKAVLAAVQGAPLPAASVSPEAEDPPERRRGLPR